MYIDVSLCNRKKTMTFNSEQEKNEFIQKVIDKLLYVPSFKTHLECLMQKPEFDIPKNIKLSHKPGEFKK